MTVGEEVAKGSLESIRSVASDASSVLEGLEKDLERLKRFEENLRIRKLRTMKGGDKIINETDDDRYNDAIKAMQTDV